MRLGALFVLCSLALAGDAVHMHNGRILKGRVVKESDQAIVVDVGAGTVTVPRRLVRLIERGGAGRAEHNVLTQRDEWFLVTHRGKLVGWRRLVHTEGPDRIHVEERTVFFRPGGGDDVDIRRVEVADKDGRPLEFLLSETYGRHTEMVSGQVCDGGALVRVRRDGKLKIRELKLPSRWTLALPAWSRFLRDAKEDERRTITALDLRRLRPVQLVMRRDGDTEDNARVCRTLTLAGDFRPARALYLPGEGSVEVELNGSTLVARRATRERVEMARRVHAAPEPLRVEEALLYPFHRRPKELRSYQVQAGLALTAPDAAWLPRVRDTDRGLVLSFENVSLFASLEAFVYDSAGANLEQCTRKALARLRLTAPGLKPAAGIEERTVDGRAARRIRLRGRHRGERLRCIAVVVPAKDRYLLILGAAPERWWRWASRDFDAFLESLDLVG